MSRLPPLSPHNFLRSFCFNIKTSSPVPLNNFLHSSCFNIPGAPQQLPAFMRFQYLSPPGLATASCMHPHLGSISRLPLLVSATSCVHRSSLFRCLTSPSNLLLSHQSSAVTWLQYLHVPPFLSTASCMHLVSISNFPPTCSSQQLPAFIFGSRKPPLRLSTFFCMYLHVSSFSFTV